MRRRQVIALLGGAAACETAQYLVDSAGCGSMKVPKRRYQNLAGYGPQNLTMWARLGGNPN
jgi:hypothetical protein